jgi:hypothetical protein
MRAIATFLPIVLALMPCLPGCASLRSEGPDPEDVPATQVLAPAAAELLALTFEASAAGYALVGTSLTAGAPTLAIDQDRDVLISARDDSGHAFQSVSVFNPRLATTAGSTNPATAVLDRASFTVRLPHPDRIRSVDVVVRRGPNEGVRQTFPVPPTGKPR